MTYFPKKLSKQNVFFLFKNPKMVSKKKCFLQNNTFTMLERCFYHVEKCFKKKKLCHLLFKNPKKITFKNNVFTTLQNAFKKRLGFPFQIQKNRFQIKMFSKDVFITLDFLPIKKKKKTFEQVKPLKKKTLVFA